MTPTSLCKFSQLDADGFEQRRVSDFTVSELAPHHPMEDDGVATRCNTR